ncbi:MAG TPA: hypothetical protein VFG12_08410 [Rhodopila sp.]|jgi:hypothetical protein|nr:hypothetical protein [Rhodopila sp.]
MQNDLIDATEALNLVLAQENALLDALDLKAAVGLLDRKREAVATLHNTLAAWPATELGAEEAEKLQDSMRRLASLSVHNRTAIERGLALQTRLIQTIAQAVPRARAQQAPVYQRNGTQLPPRPPEAFTFRSRI